MVMTIPAASSRGDGSISDDETAIGDVGESVSQISSSRGRHTDVSSVWSDRATWRDSLPGSPRFLRKMIRLPSGHYRRLSRGNRLPLYDVFFSCSMCRHAPRYKVVTLAAKPRNARSGWKRRPQKAVARAPSEASSQYSTTSSSPHHAGSAPGEALEAASPSPRGSTSPSPSDSQARKKRRSVDSGATSGSKQSTGPYIPSPTAPSSRYFTAVRIRSIYQPSPSGIPGGPLPPIYAGAPNFPSEGRTPAHTNSFLLNPGFSGREKGRGWTPQHYPAPAWSVASQRDAGLLPTGEMMGGFGGAGEMPPPYRYGSIGTGGGGEGQVELGERFPTGGGLAAEGPPLGVGGSRPSGFAAAIRSGTGSIVQTKKKASRIDSRLHQRLWGRRYPSKGSSSLSRRSLIISSGAPVSAPPRPVSPLLVSGETPNLPALTDTAPKKTRSLTNTSSSSSTTAPVIPREPPELPAPSDQLGAPPTLRQLSAAKEEPMANEEDEEAEQEEGEPSTLTPEKIVVEVGTLKGHLNDAALPPEGSVQVFLLCGATTDNLQQMLDHTRNKSPMVRLQIQPSGDFAASFAHVFCLPLEKPLPAGIRVTVACTRETSRVDEEGKRHFSWRLNDIGSIICPYGDLTKVQTGSWDVYPVRQNPAAKFNADRLNLEAKFSVLPASRGPPIPPDTIDPFKHPPPSPQAKTLRPEAEHATAALCLMSSWRFDGAAAAALSPRAGPATAEVHAGSQQEKLLPKQLRGSRFSQTASPGACPRSSFSASSFSSASASAFSSAASKKSSSLCPPSSVSSLFAAQKARTPSPCSPVVSNGAVNLLAAGGDASDACSRQSRTRCDGSSSTSHDGAEYCSRSSRSPVGLRQVGRGGGDPASLPAHVEAGHFLSAFKQEVAASPAGSSLPLSSRQSSLHPSSSRTKVSFKDTGISPAAATAARGAGGDRAAAKLDIATTQTETACAAAGQGVRGGRSVVGCQAIRPAAARPAAGSQAVADTAAKAAVGKVKERAIGAADSGDVLQGEASADVERSLRDAAAAARRGGDTGGAAAMGGDYKGAVTPVCGSEEEEAAETGPATANESGPAHALMSVHPKLSRQLQAATGTHAPAAAAIHWHGAGAAAAVVPPVRGKIGRVAATLLGAPDAAERHYTPPDTTGLARAVGGAAGARAKGAPGAAPAAARVVLAAASGIRAGGAGAGKAVALQRDPTHARRSRSEAFASAARTAAAQHTQGTAAAAEEEEEAAQIEDEEAAGEAAAEAVESAESEVVPYVQEEDGETQGEVRIVEVEAAEDESADVGAADAVEAAQVEAAESEAEEAAVVVVEDEEEAPPEDAAAEVAAEEEPVEQGETEEEEEAAETAEDAEAGVVAQEDAMGKGALEEVMKHAIAEEHPRGEQEEAATEEEASYGRDRKGRAAAEDAAAEYRNEVSPRVAVASSDCYDYNTYWEAGELEPPRRGSSNTAALESASVMVQPAAANICRRNVGRQKQRTAAATTGAPGKDAFSFASNRAAALKQFAGDVVASTASSLEQRSSPGTTRSSSTDCNSYSGTHDRGGTSNGSSSTRGYMLYSHEYSRIRSALTFVDNTRVITKCSPTANSSSDSSSARRSSVLWPPSLPRPPPRRQQQQHQGKEDFSRHPAGVVGESLSSLSADAHVLPRSVGSATCPLGATGKTSAALARPRMQRGLAAPHVARNRSVSTVDTNGAVRKPNSLAVNSKVDTMKHEPQAVTQEQSTTRSAAATTGRMPVLSAVALLDMAATRQRQRPQQPQRLHEQQQSSWHELQEEQHGVGEGQQLLGFQQQQQYNRLSHPPRHENNVPAERQEQQEAAAEQQEQHHFSRKARSFAASDRVAYASSSAGSWEILKQIRETHTLSHRKEKGRGSCSPRLSVAVASAAAAISAPLPPPPVPRCYRGSHAPRGV